MRLSLAHEPDEIVNMDLPHLLTHAKQGLKAPTLGAARTEFRHVMKHGRSALVQAKKMQANARKVPGVMKHVNDLNRLRRVK